MVPFTWQTTGATEGFDASILAEGKGNVVAAGLVLEVVMNVTGDEQVKLAVAIVISPGGASGPVPESYAGGFGDIGECAVVVVVVEAILAKVADVDVRPAVVIVVADGDAEAPAVIADTGLGCDVGECAVVVVVEESGVWSGAHAVECVFCASVDEVDVEPTVIVVVEKSDTGTDGVDDGFLVG